VGRESNLVGRDSNLVGRDSSLVGRESNLVGRDSSLVGRESNLVGRESNLVGRDSNLVGRDSNLVGRESYLMGRDSNLVGTLRGGRAACSDAFHTPAACCTSGRRKCLAGDTGCCCVAVGSKETVSASNSRWRRLVMQNRPFTSCFPMHHF
uniref:Uncharacterized protein n=1 Tax=Oryzias melastigma TaxID=30732 RepID=A0A3B3CWW4_ORYME